MRLNPHGGKVKQNGCYFLSFSYFVSRLSVPRKQLGRFSRSSLRTMQSVPKVPSKGHILTKVHLGSDIPNKHFDPNSVLSSQISALEKPVNGGKVSTDQLYKQLGLDEPIHYVSSVLERPLEVALA